MEDRRHTEQTNGPPDPEQAPVSSESKVQQPLSIPPQTDRDASNQADFQSMNFDELYQIKKDNSKYKQREIPENRRKVFIAEDSESTNQMNKISEDSCLDQQERNDVKRKSLLESMQAQQSYIIGICNDYQSVEKSTVEGNGPEQAQASKDDRVGKLLLLKDGEGSSEYEGSIFEDENTSSNTSLEDSGNNSRHSLGSPTAQHAVIKDGKEGSQLDENGIKLVSPITQQKKISSKVTDSGPLPLIKAGISIAADMRFGWRPQEKEVHGAPIPLHYDFEPFFMPINPVTNRPYQALFLGDRIRTSIDVHKKFANILNLTVDECPNTRPKNKPGEPYPSYSFKFPLKTPYMLPHSFDERPAFTGMNPKIDFKEELIFDSSFESGNLDMVIKTNPQCYDLYMRVDTNTRGHHQWFYFSIEIPVIFGKQTITFRVVNFTKPQSLYTNGMRICYAKKSHNYEWVKGGNNIQYGRSHIVRRRNEDPTKVIYYSMLTFTFDFEKTKEKEKIFFAYCYPYTFTMLQSFLRELNLMQGWTDIFKESVLCSELSGVDVPFITISSRLKTDPKGYNQIKLSEFEDDDSKLSLPMYKKKKYVIVTARVHPGESNSSYMMQGFIKYLLGDSHQAKQLRKRVVFKIVPMLNVDGVIIGNYRTSMSGNDLNRRYVRPDFRIHPSVSAIKQLATDLIYGLDDEAKKKDDGPVTFNEDILAFVDMHGHSRKKNVFIYGPQEPLHSDKYLRMRIIPKLIAEETNKFRYHSCRFRLEQSKLKAARIVMWREFNIMNCFTFEASLHGYFDQNNTNFEFTRATYEEMGEHLANSFFEYLMIMEEEERIHKLKEIAKKKKQKQKQLALQRAAQPAKETVHGSSSVVSQASCLPLVKDTKENAQGNYLNLPPSGKLGKKGSGSSSSRNRNVSQVANKDSDKETTTKENVKKAKKSANEPKEKNRKVFVTKKETGSSLNEESRNGNLYQEVSSHKIIITQNPNEPPSSELNESLSEDQSSIQVGSRELGGLQSDELLMYANTELTNDYEQELVRQSEGRRKNHGFRNLKDMFDAVREQEDEAQNRNKKQIPGEESDFGGSDCCCSDVSSENNFTGKTTANDDLEDEISHEQQKKLQIEILNAISEFVKINNQKEHEYYGVSKETLKKHKKTRIAQQAAQILREKETEIAAAELAKEKPTKMKKTQRKRQSTFKDNFQATGQPIGSTLNYQSNTLSVAQKRRSFNADAGPGPKMKQVITNEQLNQQLAHYMGSSKMRSGLSSPIYQNLYQSASNFSNFYVHRFDERSKQQTCQFQKQLRQLHQLPLTQPGEQSDQSSPEATSLIAQPQTSQSLFGQQQIAQQQQMRVLQQDIPSPPEGYHSVQNETGKIYHLSKNTDGTGNHHMISSIMPPADGSYIKAKGTYGMFATRRSAHTKEFQHDASQKSIIIQRDQSMQHQTQAAQLELIRHSQHQQAVQPMIFNFFNTKNEVKQRNHNRQVKVSDRGVGSLNNAGGPSQRHSHQQGNAELGHKKPISETKKPVPVRSQQKQEFLDTQVSGGSYNQRILGLNQSNACKQSQGVRSDNQRYPGIPSAQGKKKSDKAAVLASHQADLNVKAQSTSGKHFAIQKSRSSFNKHEPAQHDSSRTPSVMKTQQLSTSSKFKNIVMATEMMKTSGESDVKKNNFKTIPKNNEYETFASGIMVTTLNTAVQSANSQTLNKKRVVEEKVENWAPELHSQTKKNKLDQQTTKADQIFETNEFKRNAIRQLHPLKSCNQVTQNVPMIYMAQKNVPSSANSEPNSAKIMLITQNQIHLQNGQNLRQQSQGNHQSLNLLASVQEIGNQESPAGEFNDNTIGQGDKKNITKPGTHMWHLDPTAEDVSNFQGAAGAFVNQGNNLFKNSGFHDPNYPYQVGPVAVSSESFGIVKGTAIKDFNSAGIIKSSDSQTFNTYGVPNIRQATIGDDSLDRKTVEIRLKHSQLSNYANEEYKTSSNNITDLQARIKMEHLRLINDHSQLRRSGDYQTKVNKQKGGLTQTFQQLRIVQKINSSEVIGSDTSFVVTKMQQTATKPRFSERVPPDLYQKNPYQSSAHPNQISSQRQTNQNSKHEIMNDSHAEDNLHRSPLLAMHQGAAQILPERHLKCPSGDVTSQWAQNLQRNNRMTGQAQDLENQNNFQSTQHGQHLPLTKSKTATYQNTFQLHQLPFQGIQNIFADPHYGIGGLISSKEDAVKPGATVGSRHFMTSPREDREELKLITSDDTKGIREMKALWMKSGQHKNKNEDNSINDLVDLTSTKNSNGSLIRIQKSKYQGLIKQRGAQMMVQSPGQISSIHSNRGSDDGLSSPQQSQSSQQHRSLGRVAQSSQQQQKRVSLGQTNNTVEYVGSSNVFNFQSPSDRIVQVADESNQHLNHKKFSLSTKKSSAQRKFEIEATKQDSPTGNSFQNKTWTNSNTRTDIELGTRLASPKVDGEPTKPASSTFKKRASQQHVHESSRSKAKSKREASKHVAGQNNGTHKSGKKLSASRAMASATKSSKTRPSSRLGANQAI